MTATMLAAPILLSNDLLTGAEWNPPQTRELLQLAADIKAHPATLCLHAARQIHRADF